MKGFHGEKTAEPCLWIVRNFTHHLGCCFKKHYVGKINLIRIYGKRKDDLK
jgi:hypothetical protein